MATPDAEEGPTTATTLIADIIPKIKASSEWRILMYGVNEPDQEEANEHHMHILSGILGKEISPDKRTFPNFRFPSNGVTVTIHIGSHSECNVSHDEVDLMVYLIPVNGDIVNHSHVVKIGKITTAHGAMVWKHSVIVFTGVDATADAYALKTGDVATRLEGVLDSWTTTVQQALDSAIANEVGINSEEVLIRPAGRRNQLDLPKPHTQWFSLLWLGCFLSSKVNSTPAILKVAQGRIANIVKDSDIDQLQLFEQHIQVKENSIQLPQNMRIGLGLGGSSAIAGAAVVGATIGAVIGAVAIGVPSFGVAAGTGLALGAVIGGGLGASVAGAAVGGSYKAAKDKQMEEIDASELKLYYAELLSRIPKMSAYLTTWAEKQINCKIVVTGVKGEGVSTVTAALIGKPPREGGSGLYLQQVICMKANLLTYDFQGFPKVGDKQLKAKELVEFQNNKNTHLLVFCIPMTSPKEDFVYSPHVKYLERLCEVNDKIPCNTVIALTHANEMRAEMNKRNDLSQTSLHQFFHDELESWKLQISTVFEKYIHIDNEITKKIPVVPVGNLEPVIDLSDDENPTPATQYHWLSEMLLHAMPATKAEGLSALIEANQQRISSGLCRYPDNAPELIVEAKCLMFSKAGLQDKKQPGEAIGMILGVKEPDQNE